MIALICVIFVICIVAGILFLFSEEDVLKGLFILFFCALCVGGYIVGRQEVQKEAIIAGVASYKQIINNGEVTNEFVWNKLPEVK